MNTPATDKWMTENNIYCGAKINDKQYALGSIKGGLLMVDSTFSPVSYINVSENDLKVDGTSVLYIYVDYAGGMWLTLNKGLSHVQINIHFQLGLYKWY